LRFYKNKNRNNNKNKKMAHLRLGDIAPDFTAETSMGTVKFHEWMGDSWSILFSHPADYTPVCTTELGSVASYAEEFKKRNVKPIALSVDGLVSHKDWIKDINETQNTTVNYPLIADEDHKVADLYDMIHPHANSNATVRSVFVIAPDKTIKMMLTYPASTGRNFDELLRVIDSLQLTAYHKVATPANWKDGDDCVILPSVKDEEIEELFPKGHTEIKPYLRMTPQPDK
jgi:alkyl hydroperoxide reductase subunit AhpC